MTCPYCNKKDTVVMESRLLPDFVGLRRRRRCVSCNKRFTTHEKVVSLDLKIIKKDGRIELYDREKLVKGIRKSCYKRHVSEDVIQSLVDDLEHRMLGRKIIQVKSSDVGKMVLSRLKKIDSLAYYRFASVYMEFESANDFKLFINN
jgi:transcriptional repressor NrdR